MVISACKFLMFIAAFYPKNTILGANIQMTNILPDQYDNPQDKIESRFAALHTVITDDVNEGRVKISACKNAIFTGCPIKVGQKVHLNETVACMLKNLDYWDEEGTCAMVFSSIIDNVYESCNTVDPQGLCFNLTIIPDRPYYLDRLLPLTCFAQNYFANSIDCRDQLDDLIGNVIPCAEEAGKYCPGDAADTMTCLNQTHSSSSGTDFSTGCVVLLSTWSADINGAVLDSDDYIEDDDIVWNGKHKTRDSLYLTDSSLWSIALKVGLALTLFSVFMIIYCIKRFGGAGDVSKGRDNNDQYEKGTRGMYIRAATGPDDWEEEQAEEEDNWRPTEI